MHAPEEFTAVTAEDHLGKTMLAGVTAPFAILSGMDQPPACKLLLHQQEDVLRDNCLMIVLDVVLRDGTVVLDSLLRQEVRGVGLLQERMTASGTVAAIRAEAGNLRYEYYQPLDDPETVLLIDGWEDQAAIDAHHASPMMATIAALREKYDLHMTVERFIGIEDNEEDGRFIRK